MFKQEHIDRLWSHPGPVTVIASCPNGDPICSLSAVRNFMMAVEQCRTMKCVGDSTEGLWASCAALLISPRRVAVHLEPTSDNDGVVVCVESGTTPSPTTSHIDLSSCRIMCHRNVPFFDGAVVRGSRAVNVPHQRASRLLRRQEIIDVTLPLSRWHTTVEYSVARTRDRSSQWLRSCLGVRRDSLGGIPNLSGHVEHCGLGGDTHRQRCEVAYMGKKAITALTWLAVRGKVGVVRPKGPSPHPTEDFYIGRELTRCSLRHGVGQPSVGCVAYAVGHAEVNFPLPRRPAVRGHLFCSSHFHTGCGSFTPCISVGYGFHSSRRYSLPRSRDGFRLECNWAWSVLGLGQGDAPGLSKLRCGLVWSHE